MKPLALIILCLLPSLALAQASARSSTSSSSTATSIAAASGQSANITGYVADGASAKGAVINNGVSLANSSARLLEVQNNGTAKWSVGTDGTTFTPGLKTYAATTLSLTSTIADGSGNVGFTFDTSNAFANGGARIASFKTGGAQKATLGIDGTLFSPGVTAFGATALTLYGNAADGASAVGVVIDHAALANSGAKSLSIRNGGVERAAAGYDGTLYSPALKTLGATTLSFTSSIGASAGTGFSFNTTNTLTGTNRIFDFQKNGSSVFYCDGNGICQIGGALQVPFSDIIGDLHRTYGGTIKILGNQQTGSGSPDVKIGSYFYDLTTAGDIVVGFYANHALTSAVATIDKDGAIRQGAGTLQTCTSALERTEAWDSTAGGTNTGARSRKCACTSDGAASPAYAWRNAHTGTVGTTTTCPN